MGRLGVSTSPIALVTGAGRGIGRAIATRLADDGHHVVLLARSPDQLAATAGEIVARGGEATALPCDITSPDAVTHATGLALATIGVPSLLVNNAGNAGPMGPIGLADAADWWRTQEVHVRGALLMMSALVPHMVANGGGRIVNICSQAGTFVTPNYSSYSVAKCALIRLSEHVDAEQRAMDVRAFPIQPGTILTELAEGALASTEARRWAPPLVDLLSTITPETNDRATRRVQEAVSRIARGLWDDRAGAYLDVDGERFADPTLDWPAP